MTRSSDIVVCGAGVWGLAGALRCARDGASVTLVDDGRQSAAHVAAGMLGARAEADSQDPDMLELLTAGLSRWPGFSEEISQLAGVSLGDDYPGSFVAACRPEHLASVRRLGETLSAVGAPAEWVTGSGLRDLEPAVGPAVSGALALPEEGQVDPRRLLPALRAGCEALGVERVTGSAVAAIGDGACASRVRLADGTVVGAGSVVIAAGHGARALEGNPGVRPVKGQILRLRVPGKPPLAHVIRTPDVYVVPRADGEIVVGATVEERADTRVTAGAVLDLLEDAIRVCPDLVEAELVETSAGLRPATQDGRPFVGRTETGGPIWATGGYRHGVLLAPVAAELIWAEVSGQPTARVGTIPESRPPTEVTGFPAS